jgi:hypothetical protein
MGAKKAANLFRIYCFMCRCGAAGYSVFMLSVKLKLTSVSDIINLQKRTTVFNHRPLDYLIINHST